MSDNEIKTAFERFYDDIEFDPPHTCMRCGQPSSVVLELQYLCIKHARSYLNQRDAAERNWWQRVVHWITN